MDSSSEHREDSLHFMPLVDPNIEIEVTPDKTGNGGTFETPDLLVPGIGKVYLWGHKALPGREVGVDVPAIVIEDDSVKVGIAGDFARDFFEITPFTKSPSGAVSGTTIFVKHPKLPHALSAKLWFADTEGEETPELERHISITGDWNNPEDGKDYVIYAKPDAKVLSSLQFAFVAKQ